MSTLDDDQQENYKQDLNKVSVALNKHIENLISRVRNSETKDIEIGLSVLLKELTGKENMVMNDV